MISGGWEEEYCRQRENRNSPKQRKQGMDGYICKTRRPMQLDDSGENEEEEKAGTYLKSPG